jgi:hypothetical protein
MNESESAKGKKFCGKKENRTRVQCKKIPSPCEVHVVISSPFHSNIASKWRTGWIKSETLLC